MAWAEIYSAWLESFFASARDWKLANNELKFDSQLKTYFWLIFIIKLYRKWQNYVAKSYYTTLKTPLVLISSDKWLWNWLESCFSSKIGRFDIHIVSSVSARKMEYTSLAWFGLELFSLAQLGKFQLELITTSKLVIFFSLL